jgi:hypothetical protein
MIRAVMHDGPTTLAEVAAQGKKMASNQAAERDAIFLAWRRPLCYKYHSVFQS